MTQLPIDQNTRIDEAVEVVRGWVEAEVPARWRTAAAHSPAALRAARSPADYQQWYPVFAASGLVVPTWAREHGGLGIGNELARAIDQELRPLRLTRLN